MNVDGDLQTISEKEKVLLNTKSAIAVVVPIQIAKTIRAVAQHITGCEMDYSEHEPMKFEKILKETSKAYNIKFEVGVEEWIPKSQVLLENDVLYMPKWMIEEKALEDYILERLF